MSSPFHSAAARVAVLLSNRLGDSLLMMSVAANLQRAGRLVTVYSAQLSAMPGWFAGFDIRPLPGADELAAALAPYGVVVQMHEDRPFANNPASGDGRFSCFDRWRLAARAQRLGRRSPLTLLGELACYAKDVFGLTTWDDHNGLTAPSGLRHRAHMRRVIVHPTAGSHDGYWPRDKYARLAQRLIARGFTPEFVVERKERVDWQGASNRFPFTFVEAASLDALAAYIHESGWFIGSDSGIGHLASACGVPTVTICERMRNMQRWKPGWAPAVVAQPVWLPLSSLRRRYWKEATTVNRVLLAFQQLAPLASGAVAQPANPTGRPTVPGR